MVSVELQVAAVGLVRLQMEVGQQNFERGYNVKRSFNGAEGGTAAAGGTMRLQVATIRVYSEVAAGCREYFRWSCGRRSMQQRGDAGGAARDFS